MFVHNHGKAPQGFMLGEPGKQERLTLQPGKNEIEGRVFGELAKNKFFNHFVDDGVLSYSKSEEDAEQEEAQPAQPKKHKGRPAKNKN